MSYWGTSRWPSKLPTTIKTTREVLTLITPSNSTSLQDKAILSKTQSISSPALHLSKSVTRESITQTLSEAGTIIPLPLTATSSLITTSSSSMVSENNIYRVSVYTKGESSSVRDKDFYGRSYIMPFTVSGSNIYYWDCFDELPPDEDDSELSRDCN